MKGFNGADNGGNLYEMRALGPIDVDSQFSSFPIQFSEFPTDLIEEIKGFEVHRMRKLRFVDLDNTLLDDERRFVIFPELQNYRGNKAYPKITERYGKNGSNGFREFVEDLNPREHLLDHSDFYDPSDENNIILTAGDLELQSLKVEAAFGQDAKKIIVEDAKDKPLAMLEYIRELGYIPGDIEFMDDKIDAFIGKDRKLASILGNRVSFYRAVPNSKMRSVELESVTRLQHFMNFRATELLRA